MVELCRAEQQITREIFAKGESRAKQKNAKELALPTQTKLFLKNFPTLQKNKNTPTHSPTITEDNDTKTQY